MRSLARCSTSPQAQVMGLSKETESSETASQTDTSSFQLIFSRILSWEHKSDQHNLPFAFLMNMIIFTYPGLRVGESCHSSRETSSLLLHTI